MTELIFISSSRSKFAHIEYLLQGSDFFITPQRNYGIGYQEPRIYNREELLQKSYESARETFEKNVSNFENKFFIFEDTSVRIDALSTEDNEVPGVDVKYWMQEWDFARLDSELKRRGNNRKCTVRSDIILHLPRRLRDKTGQNFKVFTGFSHGVVVREEEVFDTSPLYPWLDNKTFNKWFVPQAYEAEDIPISKLPIEQATRYDFRRQSVKKLVEYLSQENLSWLGGKSQNTYKQNTLFDPSDFILLGSTCAGKSTLAEYLSKYHQYYHIEASDFMHMEYYKRHGTNSSVHIADFAEKALIENPTIVASKVVEFCNTLETPIVISGFRSPNEVEYYMEHSKKRETTPVFIDTRQALRYDRCKIRKREDAAYTFESFQRRDRQQYKMGLEALEKEVQLRIQNNDTKDTYFKAFEESFSSKIRSVDGNLMPKKSLDKLRLGELILLVLSCHPEDFFTTAEIAGLINSELNAQPPRSKNNVSRYFNQHFYPYYEIKHIDGKNRFRISQTGMSQLRYLLGDCAVAVR